MKFQLLLPFVILFTATCRVHAQDDDSGPYVVSLYDSAAGIGIFSGDSVYITAGSSTEAPAMPRLIAMVNYLPAHEGPPPPGEPPSPIGMLGDTVSWKLKIEHPTVVNVPPPAYGKISKDKTAFKATLPRIQKWKIFKEFKDDENFVGGKATLVMRSGDTDYKLTFFILGKNPLQMDYLTYLNSIQNRPYYALAIGKVESSKNSKQFYEQDNSGYPGVDYRKAGYPLLSGPFPRPKYPVGSDGGYGLFQLTNPIPNIAEKWDWRANCDGAVKHMLRDRATAGRIIKKIGRLYPEASNDPIPDQTFPTPDGTVQVSALDAIAIMAYNGVQQDDTSVLPFENYPNSSYGYHTPFTYDAAAPAGSRWTFHDNNMNYVHKVTSMLQH